MVAPGPNVTAVDSNVEGKTPELGTTTDATFSKAKPPETTGKFTEK